MLAPGFNRWGQVLLHFGTSPFEDSVKAVSGEMQHLRALRSFVRCSAPLASSKSAVRRVREGQASCQASRPPVNARGSLRASAKVASHGPRSIPNWYNRPSGCAGVHRRGTSARCVMLLRSLPKLGFVNERGVEFSAASVRLDAGHLTGGQLISRNPPSDQRTCFGHFSLVFLSI